jgi:hypothetical protein
MAFGFSPVQTMGSTPYTGGFNIYAVLAADTNSIAVGDAVKSGSTGNVRGYPTVTRIAATTEKVRGVVVSVLGPGQVNAEFLNSSIRPAGAQTADWYVLVADSPDMFFVVQSTAITDVADLNKKADITIGANNGFVSGDRVNENNATATQVLIISLAQTPNNPVGSADNYVVKFIGHELA